MKTLISWTIAALLLHFVFNPTVATSPDHALLLLQRFGIPTNTQTTPNDAAFLDYSIFRGHSALRDLPRPCQDLLLRDDDSLSKASKALLLLCAGYGDAAHEVVLGVTFVLEDDTSSASTSSTSSAMETAEYAATHPGETMWSRDHPLDGMDDLVHSMIHRVEGHAIGEGGHAGFDNADYWAAGGPKACDTVVSAHHHHAVYEALCDGARNTTPLCVKAGVIAPQDTTTTHDILADGGTQRNVKVPQGCWDSIRFIDLCRSVKKRGDNDELQAELDYLHHLELHLLLQYEEERKGRTTGKARDLLESIK
jgi:hypothetical protein